MDGILAELKPNTNTNTDAEATVGQDASVLSSTPSLKQDAAVPDDAPHAKDSDDIQNEEGQSFTFAGSYVDEVNAEYCEECIRWGNNDDEHGECATYGCKANLRWRRELREDGYCDRCIDHQIDNEGAQPYWSVPGCPRCGLF